VLELIETEPVTVNNQAFRGAKLFKDFKPMYNSARIIKLHHLSWDNGKGKSYMGENVTFSSHIIHLADSTCSMISAKKNILTQLPDILSAISEQSETVFNPSIVDALFELII